MINTVKINISNIKIHAKLSTGLKRMSAVCAGACCASKTILLERKYSDHKMCKEKQQANQERASAGQASSNSVLFFLCSISHPSLPSTY